MRRRGNSTLEFTLVGIPLIFTLISTFEMSRGMWVYHTMAHAIKEGTRYASVHGADCDPAVNAPNNCLVGIRDIAQRIKDTGIGLEEDALILSFRAGAQTHACPNSSSLTDCLGDAATWPPAPYNVQGVSLQITGKIRFRSALAMFWPGSSRGINFGTIYFPASSQETIEF